MLLVLRYFRTHASGIIGAVTAVNTFGATKLYSHFVQYLGLHGTFWLYGCIMLVEVIFAFLVLPENKGISLLKTEDKMIQSNNETNDK